MSVGFSIKTAEKFQYQLQVLFAVLGFDILIPVIELGLFDWDEMQHMPDAEVIANLI